MAENEDVNTLQRRGRRRLVGAIALVLAAVIVLPMVFDSEPRHGAPPVSVRIPGEDDTAFRPKVTPKAPREKAPEKAAEKPAEKAAEKAAEKEPEKPVPRVTEKPASPSAESERARAERALAGGEQFVVQIGAFADPEKIKEVSGKLKSAKVPYYTEQVPVKSGMLTRVRAGPFTSREAAEQSLKKLHDMGLKGSKIIGLS